MLSANYTFASPVFGPTTADGSLLVADAGAGIVRLHRGKGTLIALLPGVSDVAQTFFSPFAITGRGTDPTSAKLYRVVNGHAKQIADLGAFEAAVVQGMDLQTRSVGSAPAHRCYCRFPRQGSRGYERTHPGRDRSDRAAVVSKKTSPTEGAL